MASDRLSHDQVSTWEQVGDYDALALCCTGKASHEVMLTCIVVETNALLAYTHRSGLW